MYWAVTEKNTCFKYKAGFLLGDIFTKFWHMQVTAQPPAISLASSELFLSPEPSNHRNKWTWLFVPAWSLSGKPCSKIKVTTKTQTQPEKNLNIMREARSSRMLPGMAGWAACCKHWCCPWSSYSGKRWAVAELRHSEASSPKHYHHKIVIYWGCNHTSIWLYRYMQRQAGQALPEESVWFFLDRNSFCGQVIKDSAILMVTIECMWPSQCKRNPRVNFPFHAYYGFPRKSKLSLKKIWITDSYYIQCNCTVLNGLQSWVPLWSFQSILWVCYSEQLYKPPLLLLNN